MNSLTTESLQAAVHKGFGIAASVRARRPGKLFQVEMPAFLDDGDGVQLYVEAMKDDRFRVSDVGQTLMRLSYTRDIDEATREKLSGVADRNGFLLSDGVIAATVKRSELVPALFGLAQVQAVAEATVHASVTRGPRAEDFRAMVIAVLREQFGDQLETNVLSDGDTDEAFAIDAVIRTKRPLAVLAVPNDIEAERAVANRFRAKSLAVRDWIAVPRNMNTLNARTRTRLTDAFIIAHSSFDGPAIKQRVLNLAS